MPAERRTHKYQYRLVWKYQGQKSVRKLIASSPTTILRMLMRVGTDEPWMGINPTQLKRTWAWLARRLNVNFDAVADVTPRNALLGLRDSFPALEYIRVETRQVAPWVEFLDPLVNLRTPSSDKMDTKRLATLAEVEGMTRAELDAWRWVPTDESQALRTRNDHG